MFAQFGGGIHDGHETELIPFQRIDGLINGPVYYGGRGDGASSGQYMGFLGNSSLIYGGGRDDGTTYNFQIQFLNSAPLEGLFNGGIDDGHSEGFIITALNESNLSFLYSGGIDDGASNGYVVSNLSGAMVDIYAGGQGDGHTTDHHQQFLEIPFNYMFAGGIDDGASSFGIQASFPANNCFESDILYVKAIASGTNGGQSWQNAFPALYQALYNAETCGKKEIWVAEGNYYPTSTENQSISFLPVSGTRMYGGFRGVNETSIRERNINEYRSILNGDLAEENVIEDNSYHILDFSKSFDSLLLDGFYIENGYATPEFETEIAFGAGILSNNPESYQYVLLKNIIINNCFSKNEGAVIGVLGENANFEITESTFYAFPEFLDNVFLSQDNANVKIVGEVFILKHE